MKYKELLIILIFYKYMAKHIKIYTIVFKKVLYLYSE